MPAHEKCTSLSLSLSSCACPAPVALQLSSPHTSSTFPVCPRLLIHSPLRQVVDMVLVALLDRHGQLDARLVPDRPQEQHLVDMPAILQAHLSHAANQNILSELRMQISRSRPAARLLRLLAAPLFDSSIYTQIRHIGKGAYANVGSHPCT